MEKLITYKGTDKDMKCHGGFQYELGKDYTDDGAIRCGDKGYHSCEAPLDVFTYFPPVDGNRFFESVADGEIDRSGEDTKIASSKLKLKAEIGVPGIVKAQVEWVRKMAKGKNFAQGYRGHAAAQGGRGHAAAQGDLGHAAAQGDLGHAAAQGYRGHAAAQRYRGHAAAQGYMGHAAAQGDRGHAAAQGDWGHAAAQGGRGHAAAQGYRGHAAAQGDWGHAEVHGKDAIAASFGIEGRAKGEIGDWLVLAEWGQDDTWHIVSVKTVMVDGKKIKADTWYTLKNGKFVEVDDDSM